MFESYINKKREKVINVMCHTATTKKIKIDYVINNTCEEVKLKFNINKEDFLITYNENPKDMIFKNGKKIIPSLNKNKEYIKNRNKYILSIFNILQKRIKEEKLIYGKSKLLILIRQDSFITWESLEDYLNEI